MRREAREKIDRVLAKSASTKRRGIDLLRPCTGWRNHLPGGSTNTSGGVEEAPVGPLLGAAGFTNQAAWDVMTAGLMTICAVQVGKRRSLGSANLRTMSRVREQLERIPEMAGMGDPVELRLQDVLVLMNQLMARMR